MSRDAAQRRLPRLRAVADLRPAGRCRRRRGPGARRRRAGPQAHQEEPLGLRQLAPAPDGTAWQIASANKTATGPATGEVERLVLLLGVDSFKTSKRFYQGQGVTTTKSFPTYVEFESGAVKLALYKRTALAEQVGIDPAGTGAHRLAVIGEATFTDPDGYAWLAAETTNAAR